MSAYITSSANQKGGVAKTTTSLALAAGLRLKGYKCLLVDMDPQTNLSYAVNATDHDITIYDLFRAHLSDALDYDLVKKTVTQTNSYGDVIAGSLNMAAADMEFNTIGRESILLDILNLVRKDYDVIIIDTPPTLGIITINAFAASDSIIIPVNASVFSMQGLAQLSNTINKVRRSYNSSLAIAGVLITMFKKQTALGQAYKDYIFELFGDKTFDTTIRDSVIIGEAQSQRVSMFSIKPKKTVTAIDDYEQFVDEFEQRVLKNNEVKDEKER